MRTFLLLLGLTLAAAPAAAQRPTPGLPRFTEEREAAALHFVGKHLPELNLLLTELRKNSPALYQQEISEIFYVSEMLADLQDDPRRHDLELRIWKTENRAHVLVARLGTMGEEERKKVMEQLREAARELVDLDIQALEIQAEQLDRELGEVREELARARDQVEQNARSRFDALLEKAPRPKK